MTTQEQIEGLVLHHLNEYKAAMLKVGSPRSRSKTSLPQKAIIVRPDGGVSKVAELGWSDLQERDDLLAMAAADARQRHASALIVCATVTLLRAKKVLPELGMAEDTNLSTESVDEFQRRLYKWIRQTTGGSRIADLSDRYTHDCVLACAVGPRIRDCVAGHIYKWDGEQSPPRLEFYSSPDMPRADGATVIRGTDSPFSLIVNVIPKWWC